MLRVIGTGFFPRVGSAASAGPSPFVPKDRSLHSTHSLLIKSPRGLQGLWAMRAEGLSSRMTLGIRFLGWISEVGPGGVSALPSKVEDQHFIHTRMVIIKQQRVSRAAEGVETSEPSRAAGGDVKWCSSCGKPIGTPIPECSQQRCSQ